MNAARPPQPLPWRDPWSLVATLAAAYGSEGLVWLDGDGSELGRWARLGIAPLESVCCRGLPGQGGAKDPFAVLTALDQQQRANPDPGGSWMGWLAYEAGAWVEPGPHWQQPAMALLWAARFSHELVFDLQKQRLWLEGSAAFWADADARRQLLQLIETPLQQPPAALTVAAERWRWHTSPVEFATQVQQIKTWIAAGDLFQANLTACCQSELQSSQPSGAAAALDLYGRLRQRCPAPFGGLAIGSGGAGGEAVLCCSPERFLSCSPGGQIETRPIKGTRPRHREPAHDDAAAAELVSSPKDRAENVMIVDLLRNDLGRVCQPGTITVPQLVGLESYPQVHHLTSVIEGQLHDSQTRASLLRACWPGGSISGAPKVRACRRLNGLEPLPRGPYCGSLFRLGGDGSLDSNIVIRSLMLKDRTLWAHAGCGIVADSQPQAEAAEMGWKIEPLLAALA